ncbi:SorT family sulfite dehydrogenase catalytic subunit [Pelomicrobium sp.]|jgi:DMSO/TMAO reductase YedYZ molybdopterin-dependent catalytic subunit|uniref:SorT family sulfite dehydrogenase catalytic subunit n=1 Tax=Pelomicrobium sp. TaxID=2815319 RepID=UPI002FDD9BBA
MHETIDRRRRQLLAGSAGALAAGMTGATAGLVGWSPRAWSAEPAKPKPLPEYVAWKDAESLIVHSASTIETKRSAFGTSLITPAERLFIRNNLPAPDPSYVADRNSWELTVEGVKNPRKLTLAQLKTLGLETVPMVLQCSGNGRGFFPHKPSGTPWTVGAAGCVFWSGVPVKAVAQALGGVAEGMRFITSTGGEKLPEGLDPKGVVVERSVPLSALEDALLAWEMNGAPIPLAHGGPLRLIVPGYTGVNNVKYVKRLAFTREETDAKIQKTSYRISPIGTKGDPSQPSVWEMNVKSWVNYPYPGMGPLPAGWVQIHGVAFGGTQAVKRVEVSLDGGRSWKEARFVGPDLGRYAWRQFVFQAELKPGAYTVTSRAIDAKGNVQPEERMENDQGYVNNSWRDHAVQVTVA